MTIPSLTKDPTTKTPTTRSLSTLRTGAQAHITGFTECACNEHIKRLEDLGFIPGRKVEVLRRAPLGDPIVYLVADYELCLRKRDAANVTVEEISR